MVNVEMTPTQQRWINDRTRELLIEGSAGSGKTIFACYKVIFYALQYPNASIYIYRKTFQSSAAMDYGFSTAVGLFKNAINFILLIGANRIAKLFGHDGIM